MCKISSLVSYASLFPLVFCDRKNDHITQDVVLQKDEDVVNAVQTNIEYIKAETLTEELEIKDQLNNGIDIVFDDVNTKLFIQKH